VFIDKERECQFVYFAQGGVGHAACRDTGIVPRHGDSQQSPKDAVRNFHPRVLLETFSLARSGKISMLIVCTGADGSTLVASSMEPRVFFTTRCRQIGAAATLKQNHQQQNVCYLAGGAVNQTNLRLPHSVFRLPEQNQQQVWECGRFHFSVKACCSTRPLLALHAGVAAAATVWTVGPSTPSYGPRHACMCTHGLAFRKEAPRPLKLAPVMTGNSQSTPLPCPAALRSLSLPSTYYSLAIDVISSREYSRCHFH
jgi:hypothetical protein